jgi:hypothetical protein
MLDARDVYQGWLLRWNWNSRMGGEVMAAVAAAENSRTGFEVASRWRELDDGTDQMELQMWGGGGVHIPKQSQRRQFAPKRSRARKKKDFPKEARPQGGGRDERGRKRERAGCQLQRQERTGISISRERCGGAAAPNERGIRRMPVNFSA